MHSPSPRTTGVAAVVAGAAFAFSGAIQATHGSFGPDHNQIYSTAEALMTAGFAAGMLLAAPIHRLLGDRGRTPRAGTAAAVAVLVLGALTTTSVINGEDLAIFNVVAPLCLLTWLVSSVLIARGLLRTGAVPRPVAYALPLLFVATIPLAAIGGPLLTGAFWVCCGAQVARGALARAAAPAVA